MSSEVKFQRIPIYTAIFATIVVIPSLMDPINLPKLWALTLGSGISFTFFLKQIWNSQLDNRKGLFFLSSFFATTLLITAVVSNQSLYKTLIGTWGRNNGFLTYFSLFVLFLTLSTMRSLEPSRFLIKSLIFLGLIAGFYGLMQQSGADFITWENAGNRIILTLGNSDFASAFLALTAIATLSLILRTDISTWLRFLFAISYLIQMYLTRKSDAIQGLIVLLFGSVILIGMHLTFSSQKTIKRLAIFWWGSLLLLSAIASLGLAGNGPLSGFLHPNLRAFQDRYYHWVAAAKMLQDNLFFGVGIDSFGDHYRNYRVVEAINLRGNATSGTNNAHNAIMQIGATGGLFLLVPYLLLILFTGYRAFIALRKSRDKALVSGIFSVWIAFQVQSLVSIDQIGLVVWGWISAGCLIAISYYDENRKIFEAPTKVDSKSKSRKEERSSKITSVLILIGILPTILLTPVLLAEYNFRNSILALVNTSTQETLKVNAFNLYSEARKIHNPELRLYAIQYLLQTEDKNLGIKLAQTTVSDFPRSFEAWDSLARIYESNGEKNKAVFARKKTVFLDPLNQDIKKLLAEDLATN
jgi:O-antigen ligase